LNFLKLSSEPFSFEGLCYALKVPIRDIELLVQSPPSKSVPGIILLVQNATEKLM